jgi:hypothetical protein
MLYYIIYSSYASRQFNDQELEQLLVQSRNWNKQAGITGMLLHFDNEFAQLIEGNESDVKTLFDVIKTDNRHKEVLIMKSGNISNRFFPDWSMAFKSGSAADFEKLEGYKDPDAPGGKNATAIFTFFKILSGQNN